MTKFRIIVLILDVVLIIGIAVVLLAPAQQAAFTFLFLPWFMWPYMIALPAWWYGRSLFAMIMTSIFIGISALWQGYVYISVFWGAVDAQSAIGWLMSPLYLIPAIILLIPSFLAARQARRGRHQTPTNLVS
jgi:hypothetical protein